MLPIQLPADLVEHINAVATWGERTPDVLEVRLFGSRIYGQERPDSDLDVAIRLRASLDECDGYATFAFRAPAWRRLLESCVPWRVDLQLLAHGSDNVASYAASGITVFCRTQ